MTISLFIGRYGEVPYKSIATQDIQDRVREGVRLEQPEGFAVVSASSRKFCIIRIAILRIAILRIEILCFLQVLPSSL